MASARTGLGVKAEGDLVIAGTRGYIYVPAPWWKTEYFEVRFENQSDNKKFYYKFDGDGLRYEIAEFSSMIRREERETFRLRAVGVAVDGPRARVRAHRRPRVRLSARVDPKTLLRRAGNWARLSPNPLRPAARSGSPGSPYRLLGRWFPFLHLGWMASLRRAVWDGDDLVLQGWAFVRGADQGPRPEFEVWLHRRSVFSASTPRCRPPRTRTSSALCRGPSSTTANMVFQARFSGETLAALPAGGTWQVRVGVTGGGRRTWGPLRRIYAFGSPAVMRLRPLGDGPARRSDVRRAARRARSCPASRACSSATSRSTVVRSACASMPATEVGSAVLTGAGQEDVTLAALPDADGVRLVGTLPPGRIVVDPEIRRPVSRRPGPASWGPAGRASR